MQAVVFFGHGARDIRWREPFDKLCALWMEKYPEIAVTLAFLENMEPNLSDALATLLEKRIDEVLIIPVFFGQGSHLRNDFPALLDSCKASFPQLIIKTSPPVGESLVVMQAIIGMASSNLAT